MFILAKKLVEELQNDSEIRSLIRQAEKNQNEFLKSLKPKNQQFIDLLHLEFKRFVEKIKW